MDPLAAVAEVLHYEIGQSPTTPHRDRSFLGTCFAFGSPRFFVTAAHCLDGVSTDGLSVCQTGRSEASLVRVNEVQRHPTADLAILSLARPFGGLTPFADLVGLLAWALISGRMGSPRMSSARQLGSLCHGSFAVIFREVFATRATEATPTTPSNSAFQLRLASAAGRCFTHASPSSFSRL